MSLNQCIIIYKGDILRKIYTIINIVVIFFVIYLALLPIISESIYKIVPNIWTCQYVRFTGNNCPFCGITSDFKNLKSPSNPLTHFIAFLLIAELVLRSILVFIDIKRPIIKKIIISDFIVHFILVFLITAYCINFFKK